MAKQRLQIVGTKDEKELFSEKNNHYTLAEEDLNQRINDWNKKDELFRSYIDESNWPYQSVVFDPRVFTGIFEKTARLLAKKPRGRLIPREGGDSLGAMINNELLKFQWDDNERIDAMPMLAKWAQMDMTARKYGASFALCKWQYERKISKDDKGKKKSTPWFDGPNFKVLNNRDCLPNPSYSTVKMWFQHRDYLTLKELQNVNDAARSKPVYKNLDLLKMQLVKDGKGGGDSREINYTSRNKSIKGLTDYLGQDESNRVIEIVTEYSNERWVTFAPKHGVVLRDIENPYDHGQIPVVMLRYYPIDDDLYGLSEIEPVERLQRGVNALVNQYLDAINMSLYTPLKIRATGVQMHTLEFGPGKKWIMNDPATDVIPYDQSPSGVTEFTNTYSFMISAIQNALGETSQGTSTSTPFEPGKTATEVRDTASQRLARDNFNQIFLSEAIKKQMGFWFLMNQQFLFSDPREQHKVLRIVGKEAIRYFQKQGLGGSYIPDDSVEEYRMAEENGAIGVNPEDLAQPIYPVTVGKDVLNKFNMDETGESGTLIIEKDDLSGMYDYIPDIETMQLPNDRELVQAKQQLLGMINSPPIAQKLMQEGYEVKIKELLEDTFEDMGFKDVEKYFGKVEQNVQPNFTGEGAAIPGQPGQGNVPPQGMGGGAGAMAQGQAGPVVSGPGPVQA